MEVFPAGMCSPEGVVLEGVADGIAGLLELLEEEELDGLVWMVTGVVFRFRVSDFLSGLQSGLHS